MGYTYVLDGATQYPGTSRDDRYGVKTYHSKSGNLPPGLRHAVAEPHTWEAHIQRLLNHDPAEPNTGTGVTPRNDRQSTLIDSIVAAHTERKPGFVMSYPTGFGKTYVTIAAVNTIKPTRVLVIAPLAYLDGWRNAITAAATGTTEWVVLNPDRLPHTFRMPDGMPPLHTYLDARADAALDDGIPITDFDVVITDEAQALAHIDSQRTRLWQRLVGWDDNGGNPRAFTINLSATNWSTPAETVSAAHILAATKNLPVPSLLETEVAYDQWLHDNFGLTYTHENQKWRWDQNTQDLEKLTRALYSQGMGAAANRNSLGMPDQQRTLHPIYLTASELLLYPQSWRSFLEARALDGSRAEEPTDPRSQYQRNIQKAALIKAPYVAELVVDYLDRGYQVIVPAWLGTTISELSRHITRHANLRLGDSPSGRWVISLTGEDTGKVRDTKIRGFQGGYFPVIITSVTTGISLHAKQERGTFDGRPATAAPRVTIFGDVRWGGKQSIQAEGRGARDGEEAEAIYCVAMGTAEVQAMANVFRNLADTKALAVEAGHALSDADIVSFSEMAEELEATIEEDHRA